MKTTKKNIMVKERYVRPEIKVMWLDGDMDILADSGPSTTDKGADGTDVLSLDEEMEEFGIQ